jgi:hypothetical protein
VSSLVIDASKFRDLAPSPKTDCYSAAHVEAGIPVPKSRRVELFSPAAWEEFTEEWASSKKADYAKVVRLAGAGDKGLDIVGFLADGTFASGWDNYQCKHYQAPLASSAVTVEIGKLIYYCFLDEYPPPRKYFFLAPKGIGTSLEKLFASPEKLKSEIRAHWEKRCENEIVSTHSISLSGELADYFEAFDFSIFSSKSVVELIEDHAKTTFHAVRFGGGLPTRPTPSMPPQRIAAHESRYVEHLLDAYGQHYGVRYADINALSGTECEHNFKRQRERFYHAEALRNFSRDTVPEGTYDALQDEIFHGVIDVCDTSHGSGYERMSAVVAHAATVALTSNPLVSVTKTQDKQGICHQLANVDRLVWVKEEENDQ